MVKEGRHGAFPKEMLGMQRHSGLSNVLRKASCDRQRASGCTEVRHLLGAPSHSSKVALAGLLFGPFHVALLSLSLGIPSLVLLPPADQYDTDVTTWSPQGRLFQVEYAMEASKQGSACVGVTSKTHTVIAGIKR